MRPQNDVKFDLWDKHLCHSLSLFIETIVLSKNLGLYIWTWEINNLILKMYFKSVFRCKNKN